MDQLDVLKVIQYSKNYIRINTDTSNRREAIRTMLQSCSDLNRGGTSTKPFHYRLGLFAVVVDHNRKILSSTRSFWGARNDKTVVKHDKFILNLKEKEILKDFTFEIFDEETKKMMITILNSAYLICDGAAVVGL
jgi:hypothetical protein